MFDLQQLPPIHHFLKGHDLQWDQVQRELSVKYIAIDAFTNPRGSVEGGMLCAMLDDVMGILATMNQTGRPATTINLSMDFFRPCQLGVVETKAYFKKEGRKILSLESEAWQHGQCIAKCHASFLVLS